MTNASQTTSLTQPSQIEVLSTDVLPLAYNASALLQSGETVTSVATTLTDTTSPATQGPVVLPDVPLTTTSGGSQIIRGSSLVVGHTYLLIWTVTLSSGAVLGQGTWIRQPF